MSQTKAQLISDLVQALNFTGTASAPANGAFLSATNTLALATNSAQRLTIKSDGGVAVGTTDLTTVGSPNKNFVVGSTTNAQEVATTLNVMEGTNNRRVKFFLDDDDGVFGIDSTASTGVAPFVVRMAQSEKIRIDQSGNLTFSMEDSSNYPTQQIKWSNDSTTTNGFYIAQHSDRLGRIWHEQGLSVVFGTNNTERMRIHHDGNVGIGTTSPVGRLHVHNAGTGSGDHAYAFFTTGDTGATASDGLTIGVAATEVAFINFREANDLVLSTSSTERMRIKANGNVGINNTNPDRKLEVQNDGDYAAKFSGGSGAGHTSIEIGQVATNGSSGFNATGGSMLFDIAGAEKMRLTTSGQLGIGTSSPAALLTLNVDTESNLGSGSEGIRITSGSSNAQLVRLGSSYSNNSVTGPGTLLYSSNKLSIRCDNDNPITFHTGSTVAERVRIDSSGRLLIGTITKGFDEGDDLTIANSTHTGITIRSGTSSLGNIYFADGTSSDSRYRGIIQYSHSNDTMRFYTSASEGMRINSSGKVGIGTTSPNAKLVVYRPTVNASNPIFEVRSNHDTTNSIKFSVDGDGEAYFSDRVGIGTTSPSNKLVVNSPAHDDGLYVLAANNNQSTTLRIQGKSSGGTEHNWDLNVARSANRFGISNGGSTHLAILDSGNVGIGTTSPRSISGYQGITLNHATHGGFVQFQDDGTNTSNVLGGSSSLNLSTQTSIPIIFNTADTERMRITNGGDLVLNSTSARVYNGHTPKLSIQGTNFSQSTLAITSNSNGTDGAYLFFVKQRSGSVGGSTAPSNGDLVGQFRYLAGDGTDTQSEVANISVNIDGTPGSNDTPGRITFATTNDGGNASTERMRITNAGHVHIGNGHGNANHRINGNGFTQGQTFLVVSAYSSSAQDTAIFFGVDSGGGNTASCGLKLGRNSSNLRSLNAGGTLNASGNDYAEYMTKSSDFTLAKGAICGINAEGKLTNKFSESISFVVKSTDPSYVGGDTWGSEDILGKKPEDKSSELPAYEEKMEAARKMVDRIAFSGQVPVNVTGTTPGQHIIPTLGTDDSITGVAKAEASLSMAEYISSVGKVIALEADGRARIIVKVA